MTSFNEMVSQGHAWLFVPTAVVLGALHGLEPGHSKTMMAAFIIAIRGTVLQAVLLGVSATISHTAIIWVLAAVGLHYSGRFNVEEIEPYLQVFTGVMVIILAGWMFRRTRRDQHAAHDHEHGGHEHGPHGGMLVSTGHETVELSVFETNVPPRFRLYFFSAGMKPLAVPAAGAVQLETVRPDGAVQTFSFKVEGEYLESLEMIPEPHVFSVNLGVEHQGHAQVCRAEFVEDHQHHHGGSEEFQDEHEKQHEREFQQRFANRHVTTGQIVMFGLTGGLLPCPSAFAVLLICLQLKQFALGFAIVLAFSLGLAITLVTVGSLAALSVRHVGKRFVGFGALARKMPYVSSAVMTVLGLAVMVQGARHLMH